ncbi:unnamed protein product, partial [Brenthis ino]
MRPYHRHRPNPVTSWELDECCDLAAVSGRFALCEALPGPGARGAARRARGEGPARSLRGASPCTLAAGRRPAVPPRRQSRSARGTVSTRPRPALPPRRSTRSLNTPPPSPQCPSSPRGMCT